MKATRFEFRFRLAIAVALYVIGFWAPWTRFGAVTPHTTAWLAAAALPARWGWLPLEQATVAVTSLAILLVCVGAVLRIWGTAYLGASVVHASAMQAGGVVAAGPYRHVRNPLYLGSWCFAVGVSILMPPSGAVFFMAALTVFYFRLILGEEAFLAERLGADYEEYRRRVRRLAPSLTPRVPASDARPSWMEGVLTEVYTLGFAGCLAVLAWDYNPQLLIRCLIVCFGFSLVSRALIPKQRLAAG